MLSVLPDESKSILMSLQDKYGDKRTSHLLDPHLYMSYQGMSNLPNNKKNPTSSTAATIGLQPGKAHDILPSFSATHLFST